MNAINDKIIYPDFEHASARELYETILKEIQECRCKIEEIRQVKTEQATFENTILALEASGRELDLATATFFNLLHCNADDEFMALSEELTPLLSDLSNEIDMDLTLALNVQRVYEMETAMPPIDRRLTQRTYEGYRDRGAFLPEDKRERLKELRKELSLASLKYGQNLLREQNEYKLHILEEEKISRLPQSALATARSKALQEGFQEGWLFDFSFPSYTAIMKYCDCRQTRETFYRDRQNLCNDPHKETSNVELVHQIVALRREIAQILGYANYADYVLKDRMANRVETVSGMLDELREAYMPLARKEVEEVKAYAREAKVNPLKEELYAWDFSYYVEQYKEATLSYDEEKTRPYFLLNAVVRAMFDLTSRLYGITFMLDETLPRYHKEVEVYRVEENGELLGVLMMDYFPRKGKQSGAWMTNYVEASREAHPVVSLVMNFTPPSQGLPSLLTFDETTTLFHEFGHALHGLLTKVPYASLSGTNVVRDFVELPSQIMENWMRSPEFVQKFARHYETQEPISDELLGSIQRNTLFLEGYSCIRQLGFGYLDLSWHTLPPVEGSIEVFEDRVLAPLALLPIPPLPRGCISTSFSHVFNGGYAVGYYGYKWAEILDADAFEEFQRYGLEDPQTAQRFRSSILEMGDAQDATELYQKFKGRGATIAALLRRSGLSDTKK